MNREKISEIVPIEHGVSILPAWTATLPRATEKEKPQNHFMEGTNGQARSPSSEPASRGVAFELPADDGHLLGATRYEPDQRFYRAFAEFFAERGVRVITYDYRGVGRSRPTSLRGFHATMTEWGKLDARAVHEYVRRHHGDGPLAILGHSFGGQLIGLVDEMEDADCAVLVGAQLGYYGNWPAAARVKFGFAVHVAIPTLTAAFGYLPGRFGLGEDLPRGVAEEWARWCRHPDYLASTHPDAIGRFAGFDRPTLFYSFTDDSFAPKTAVNGLLGRLSAAPLEHRRRGPHDFDGTPIGHFGFFRRNFSNTLWPESLAYVLDVFGGRTPDRRDCRERPWDVQMSDVLADLRMHGRS
jgi:predicted alpha/beta hydrolase